MKNANTGGEIQTECKWSYGEKRDIVRVLSLLSFKPEELSEGKDIHIKERSGCA